MLKCISVGSNVVMHFRISSFYVPQKKKSDLIFLVFSLIFIVLTIFISNNSQESTGNDWKMEERGIKQARSASPRHVSEQVH